jgi:hypothetical protein
VSFLLLHNGNCLVKPWASKFYNCDQMVCLTDSWPDASTLQEKYQLASTTSICTDLTTADVFDIKELFNAKQSLKIVKVITTYENDLTNLEPVWQQNYSKEQWLISTFSRLSCADQVVFQQPVLLPCLQSGPDIIFTPGRSGTHVLRGITNVHNYLHHNDNLLMSDKFTKLIDSKKIISVLRRQFIDQVCSDAIGQTHGIVVSDKHNIVKNCQIMSKWKPIKLSTGDYQHTLEKICSYVDVLLGVKMFYNKHVEFSLLDDLQEHFNNIFFVKNPYRSQDIISNYSEAVAVCEQEYQPIYDQIITILQRIFGTNLYNHLPK